MSYEIGLAFAMLVYAAEITINFARIFSQETYNLAKIGVLYSPGGANYYTYNSPEDKPKMLRRIMGSAFSIIFSFAFCFLSWLYLFFGVLLIGYRIRQILTMPEEIKAASWKLENADLHRDQVIENVLIRNGNWSEDNVRSLRLLVNERFGEDKAS